MTFFYCKKCLMPSTRPRIEFNKEGVCNGCTYTKKMQTFDWSKRWKELEQLCGKYCGNGTDWDMIIPFSGGKDSYHIAHNFKQLGMKPLLVKLAAMIPSKIGFRNEQNIRKHGFDLIVVYPDDEYRRYNKIGLVEQGRPWLAFETGITTAVIKLAIGLGIKWICYGEEGETIYGGRTDYLKSGFDSQHGVNRKWIVDTYFSGNDTSKAKLNTPLWKLPTQKALNDAGIFYTHWSHFSDYDPEKHLRTAKELGFESFPKSPEDGVTGFGTFTDYTSLDDPWMRTFNTYLMFLKFGFGRGAHEATTEIRYGRITRDEGEELAEYYDDYDCIDFWDKLAEYYGVDGKELEKICDSHANKSILYKDRGVWFLRPEINFGLTMENPYDLS